MQAQYRRASSVVWRKSHDAVLVRPVVQAEIVALSGTAEAMWELLVDRMTIDELSSKLAQTYAAPAAQIRDDIAPMLDDLVARGVIDRAVAA